MTEYRLTFEFRMQLPLALYSTLSILIPQNLFSVEACVSRLLGLRAPFLYPIGLLVLPAYMRVSQIFFSIPNRTITTEHTATEKNVDGVASTANTIELSLPYAMRIWKNKTTNRQVFRDRLQ
jgi:hypothetical protein